MRASAFEGLGRAALKLNDKDRAENAFQRALRIEGNLPTVCLELADLNFEKDNLAGARAFYLRYLKLIDTQPQTARSLWLGIRMERRLGDRNALSSYELALKKLYPDSAEYKAYVASLEVWELTGEHLWVSTRICRSKVKTVVSTLLLSLGSV
jgi:type IV pilus assembly protein PilF